jgi:hypothetical protein
MSPFMPMHVDMSAGAGDGHPSGNPELAALDAVVVVALALATLATVVAGPKPPIPVVTVVVLPVEPFEVASVYPLLGKAAEPPVAVPPEFVPAPLP